MTSLTSIIRDFIILGYGAYFHNRNNPLLFLLDIQYKGIISDQDAFIKNNLHIIAN